MALILLHLETLFALGHIPNNLFGEEDRINGKSKGSASPKGLLQIQCNGTVRQISSCPHLERRTTSNLV